MVGVFVLRGPLGVMLDAPALGPSSRASRAVCAMLDRARLIPRGQSSRVPCGVSRGGHHQQHRRAHVHGHRALALAWRWGPYAVMTGSIARAAVIFVHFAATAPRAEWLEPAAIEKSDARRLFGYGRR